MKVFHLVGKMFVRGVIFWKYKPPGGATGDETLAFGNPNLTKKSGFEKYLVD